MAAPGLFAFSVFSQASEASEPSVGEGSGPVTGDYTVTENDVLVEVDAALQDITIFLPPLATSTTGVCIVRIDSSAFTVLIKPNGVETIVGALNKPLGSQYIGASLLPGSLTWLLC